MPSQCPTCPFRTDAKGKPLNASLMAAVQLRCLSANQICHHPRLTGKPETHLCRGARDWCITIFHRMGVLDEPTDAAWARALKNRWHHFSTF